MSFQYLIGAIFSLSGNNTKNLLSIGDWEKNVDEFQKNEGGN